jgi:glucose/arabinose dehydrogenase
MKHMRRGHGFSLVSALALVAAAGKADTMVGSATVAGTPANLFDVAPRVTGLGFPTSFAFLPDGRMLITDKGGELLIADTSGATTGAGNFTVDTESEKGLLNVLVHPNFASNRLLIFYYSAATSIGGTDVARHRVVTVPLGTNNQLDMSQETILVQGLRGPANHDGGALAIGPDGKLYIGVGDTGCNSGRATEPAYTPTNFFGTCLTVANGKILRVNLDGSIPTDNPLVNAAQVTACGTTCGTDVTTLAPATTNIRTDVWAWGFRNPWRISFDKRTGNLWVGDVGEVTYEELNIIPPSGGGKHYGWPWREGSRGHPASACQQIEPNAGDCVDPQYFCRHSGAQGGIDGNCAAIMGGAIVDSCHWPTAFQGRYFFGDHNSRWIASVELTPDRNGLASPARSPFINTSQNPTHIDVGPDGALYYATLQPGQEGTIQRVAPKSAVACPQDAGTGAGGAAGNGGTAGAAGNAGAANGGTAGAAGTNPGNGGTGQGGVANAGGTSGNAGTANAGTGNAGRGNAGQGGTGTAGTNMGGALGGEAPTDASTEGIAGAGDESSCGCRVVTNSRRDYLALWSLALGAGLIGRRRKRR